MATYSSDKVSSLVPARVVHAGVTSEIAFYSASGTFSAGDVIQMVKVEPGAQVVDVRVYGNTLATSGGATLSVGDGGDSGRYIATATVGATVVGSLNKEGGVNYEYTVADTVDVLVAAVGGDPTAQSVVKVIVELSYDDTSVV